MLRKVLHVVSSMDPVLGGVCKAVRTIATGLINSGIYNEVVSLDDSNADFIASDSFNLNALGASSNPWGYNAKLFPWLKDNITRFDYVIVHGLWLYSSYAVYLAMKSVNSSERPMYFVMPHGMLDPYFQKAEGRRLKAIRNLVYWKFIEHKVVNNAHGLLFTCEEERLLARKPFNPYHPKKELVVGLGVEAPPAYSSDMDDAFFERCTDLRNKPFLLFLSRIHEKKGVDLLIKAYENLIVHSKLELPALVIAGPGLETVYGQQIEKLVSQNEKLAEKVSFPGMLSGNAKWGAFYNSEAFILPSHQENFGIAVVEALACGKPVLISNQVNIWKEIHQASAGLVSNDTLVGTQSLLEEWLLLSLNDKIILKQKAQDCYQTYYSIPSMVEHWRKQVLQISKRF